MSAIDDIRRKAKLAERARLRALLEKHGGNQAAVARELGISRGAVVHRCILYGLQDPPESRRAEYEEQRRKLNDFLNGKTSLPREVPAEGSRERSHGV